MCSEHHGAHSLHWDLVNLSLSLISNWLHFDGPDKAEAIEEFFHELVSVLILDNFDDCSRKFWMGIFVHESFVGSHDSVAHALAARVGGDSATSDISSHWNSEQGLPEDWRCGWNES